MNRGSHGWVAGQAGIKEEEEEEEEKEKTNDHVLALLCLAYLPLRLLDCFGFEGPLAPPPPIFLLISTCAGEAPALAPAVATDEEIGDGIAGALFAFGFASALALALDDIGFDFDFDFDFDLDDPRGGSGSGVWSPGAG